MQEEEVKDYAFINVDDLENKKIFFVTRNYPTILEVEYPKPKLDPKLFMIEENKMDKWEIHEDKVVATYTTTEKTLDEEKEKIKKFFNGIYKSVRAGGLAIDEDDQKLFISTKEENYEYVIESLKEINENDNDVISWTKNPVQWTEINKQKLEMVKDRIINHYEKCEENLDFLLDLVDACQTIHALYEIEYLEGWPNVLLVTYDNDSVRMFLMTDLLDEDGYLRYERTETQKEEIEETVES